MQIEIEAKFTDVNPNKIREKLKNLGGKLVFPERLMKRKVFDFKDKNLYNNGAWMRVRDEGGGKITMSYKCLRERTLHGTNEITIEINNFDSACDILKAIGLINKSYQETKREIWELNGVEVTIDTWPWIPTFVEIEADDEEKVKSAASNLGFDWQQAMFGSVENVYQMHFDATEKEIDSWESITFVPIPDWLESKRKKLND